MKLILFRHGLAMDREVSAAKKLDDTLRPLTKKGVEKTLKMAHHLNELLLGDVQVLVSSPLIRAQQTAEVIAGVIQCERYLESTELVPSAPPQAFANWLKSHAPNATSVIAVGHEPQLSVFASWILSGLTDSFFDLKKSGVIILDLESFDQVGPRAAQLQLTLSPKSI